MIVDLLIPTGQKPPFFWLIDENFNKVEIIEGRRANYSVASIEWTTSFEKADSFAANIPLNREINREMIDKIMAPETAFILRGDTLQLCWITRKKFENDVLDLAGEGLEGLFVKRFTSEADYLPVGPNLDVNFVGRVMCDIINNNNPFAWAYAERLDNNTGPSIATFTEATGNVFKYLQNLSKTWNVAYGFRYNPQYKRADFKTKEVLPIGVQIPGRTYKLYESMGNIRPVNYTKDTSKYMNFCRVMGEEGHTAFVDIRPLDGSNQPIGERYDFSIKAKARLGDMGVPQYMDLLQAEGKQELSKRRIDEVFSLEPIGNVNIDIGWEVDIGSRSLGITRVLFCTEIKEVWEGGYIKNYTFGYQEDPREIEVARLSQEI